ncbi:MAG: hypothetical protein R3Y53_01830 [Bacillota bacterium]
MVKLITRVKPYLYALLWATVVLNYSAVIGEVIYNKRMKNI